METKRRKSKCQNVFLYIVMLGCILHTSCVNANDDRETVVLYTNSIMDFDEDMVKSSETNSHVTRNDEGYVKDTGGINDSHHGSILSDSTSPTISNLTITQNGENTNKTKEQTVEAYHSIQTIGLTPNARDVPLNIIYVNNPMRTLSVYEPLHDGTCQKGHWKAASVLQTAQNKQCLLAVNAGFYNTTTGECYGNIVSDGRMVQNTTEEINDVHFGIMRNGSFFVGYVTDDALKTGDFLQLVGGVLWVLKDGEINVDKSIETDYNDTQTTGTLEELASVIAARTLVGHDAYGRVMILQVDGITEKQGVSLYDAAEIMKKFGAINAINLDGGGSSTLVINHTLVNFPSDICKHNNNFQCIREVTTVLCVHEPLCDPPDCEGHGSCDLGQCHCHGYWTGRSCGILKCPSDCSDYGKCTEDGCKCFGGFHGDDCSCTLDESWNNNRCQHRGQCEFHGQCSNISGVSNNIGKYYKLISNDGHERSHKQAKKQIKVLDEYRYTFTIVFLATTTFLSMTLNLLCFWKYYTNF